MTTPANPLAETARDMIDSRKKRIARMREELDREIRALASDEAWLAELEPETGTATTGELFAAD